MEAPSYASSESEDISAPKDNRRYGWAAVVGLALCGALLICLPWVLWWTLDDEARPPWEHEGDWEAKPEDAGALLLPGPEFQELGSLGYNASSASSDVAGQGAWCAVAGPSPTWALQHPCGPAPVNSTEINVLTYNLFWWNLFGQRNGNDNSAGRLLGAAQASRPFDIMGFQECEDVDRILGDSGLIGQYGVLKTTYSVAVAYYLEKWELLGSGVVDVAEDSPELHYGRRCALWARLRHRETGVIVFFVAHHGPLPINVGGICTGPGTAYNILRVFGYHSHPGDTLIMAGDFNADPTSQTIQLLQTYMNRDYTGNLFAGIDHFFSRCAAVVSTNNLGTGGSDHDALSVIYRPAR